VIRRFDSADKQQGGSKRMAIDIDVLKKKWKKIDTPRRVKAPPNEYSICNWERTPFIDFDDPAIPLWERKKKFLKWIMRQKGMTEQKAKIICARKFYHEERES
jgi:hypothetical protein